MLSYNVVQMCFALNCRQLLREIEEDRTKDGERHMNMENQGSIAEPQVHIENGH